MLPPAHPWLLLVEVSHSSVTLAKGSTNSTNYKISKLMHWLLKLDGQKSRTEIAGGAVGPEHLCRVYANLFGNIYLCIHRWCT